MSEKNTSTLTEIEVLYKYDGPLISVVRDSEDQTWLTNATESSHCQRRFLAVEVSDVELAAVKEGRLSLRGAYAQKPWRGMRLDNDGYAFTAEGGPAATIPFLPSSGEGLRDEWEGLPDSLNDPSGALTEVEVLYEFDGPLIVVLQEAEGPMWLTNATHMGKAGITYLAVRISQAELEAIKEGQMSLRGAYAEKPWREMWYDGETYAFLTAGGPPETLKHLPSPGVGLRQEWKGLPDRLPDPLPSP